MAAESRPGRTRRLIALGVALVVVIAAIVVLFTPAFALRDVEVRGTAILTPEEVTEAADAPMGRPLLRVSEGEIAERVAALTPVAEVEVRRVVPDRLLITVSERRPVFVLDHGQEQVLVDHEGIAFAPARAEADLVTAKAPADPATLEAIATVVTSAGDLPVERVEAASPDSVTLFLPEDRRIIAGSAQDADLKIEVARTLLESTDAKFIDVTAPNNPSTR